VWLLQGVRGSLRSIIVWGLLRPGQIDSWWLELKGNEMAAERHTVVWHRDGCALHIAWRLCEVAGALCGGGALPSLWHKRQTPTLALLQAIDRNDGDGSGQRKVELMTRSVGTGDTISMNQQFHEVL
jgi:hypothetical protein